MKMLNKVPEITIFFWIIKVLATTVGETGADFLSTTMKLGLVGTSYVMSALFLIALLVQLKSQRYIPALYWLVVVLVSVVGTLLSDNLVDRMGVSLATTSIIFASALLVVFVLWYLSEKTLSVHIIETTKRELFYWAAILCTFSLGTSAGDLIAERLGVGYALSALIFAGVIAATYIAYRFFKLNAILAFWIAYIFTRPLGASLGDLLTQPVKESGLGLGTVATSSIFLITIIGLVIYLTRRQKQKSMSLNAASH
ncbi:membrane protein [Capsulimonas corticalis]|uniref:Membrane protein n=1 Tax=Capsulimonas corticalis TaxID=2219043 RepID=A0A402D489_9BACT|nr:YbfB/YjiJ family MFS transporter [Capsulimonas corticalis]BDI31199.1 membrane protein [Capsulimonas corticalis]